MRPRHRTISSFVLVAVGFLTAIGFTVVVTGQGVPQQTMGLPDDWTHHHVVFSNSGTFADALKNGTLEQWYRITSEPRYKMQQLKRSLLQRQLAAAPDFAARMALVNAANADAAAKKPSPHPKETLNKDWSEDMGTGARGAAGQYPAKYSFSTSSASCSDFVVFNTGVAGGSGGQPNIIAYSNLYSGTCTTGSVPTVSWAYYSGGGSALTSPVLSLDGTKVAFVENTSSGAILRVIEWHSGQGTASAAATPTKSYTNTTVGAGGNKAWNTTNCPTSGSCMISVAFQNVKQDTISGPYYDYNSDTVYVGDASGNLHEFAGVFNGTPAEVTSGGWPIAVSSNVLTSPTYDPGTSQDIFVADSGGYLYSYTTAGAAVMKSSQLAASGSKGIVDAPLVDSTTEEVYVFVGQDFNNSGNTLCDNTNGCDGVFQFAASTSGIGTSTCAYNKSNNTWGGSICGKEAVFGGATSSTIIYDGAFDQAYYNSPGSGGNLWVCAANPTPAARLNSVPFNTGTYFAGSSLAFIANNITQFNPLTSTSSSCSPVTEIDNGSTDYIFLGVTGTGNQTGCSSAGCIYNFNVTSGVPSAATDGLAAASGSSGIIIDNISTSLGASQIYFSTLGSQSCTGGTGGCAVQASQSTLSH
jgi:hypothetical protein